MTTKSPTRLRRVLGASVVAGVVAGGTFALAEGGASADRPSHHPAASSCRLGNGVKHVISLVFDNVHFARDNPNVPSDLEQMPHLLHFLENNGTVLSNLHTPMIAHTADDSLAIYTGLYGDRHGQPLTNSYKTFNPDGTTDPAASFAYWTSPVVDTASSPASGHDTLPTMAYSPTTPAKHTNTGQQTPAPWVPFTRAGCSVGDFSTANMVLENTGQDIKTVFGANSPEAQQLAADPDSFKDNEVADYIGVAVHCAKARRYLRRREGGQVRPDLAVRHRPARTCSRPSPAATTATRPCSARATSRPCSGRARRTRRTTAIQVTNSSGNLVDLNGNEIDGAFTSPARPGFPGFSPTPAQSLAYIADMQESGIPVTYGYISDMHERKATTTGSCTTATATKSGNPVGPGDSCYVEQRQGLRRRVPEVLRAAAAGRHHAGEHAVPDQRRGERPVRRRERRTRIPADPGRLRRCDRAVQLRRGSDRRAAGQHQGPALDDAERQHAVRHRAAGRVDLRARPARGRQRRRSASSSATPRP